MQTLGTAHPYFVRCLKPNLEKAPLNFNSQIVLNQLRYSGMMETVRIRRAGYPVRRVFDDFIFRFVSSPSLVLSYLTYVFQLQSVVGRYQPRIAHQGPVQGRLAQDLSLIHI